MGWETILTNQNLSTYAHSSFIELSTLNELGASKGEHLIVPPEDINGETFTPYKLYYLNSNGKFFQTDATTDANGAKSLIGIATDSNTLLIAGYFATEPFEADSGAPLYLDTYAGAISPSAPTWADNAVRIVGYALLTTEEYTVIRFYPDSVWLELSINI
jgi:hypothetical protein